MRQKGQILMFSDAELSLIKNTFSENEDLLYIIRKHFLQLELTKEELKVLKTYVNDEVIKVLRKRIMPDIDGDVPFRQVGDIYQTLTNDLKVKSVDDMEYQFKAKQLEIDYLEQQFNALKEESEGGISLEEMKSLKDKGAEEMFIDTTARNFLLGYIDGMLDHIKILAGQKIESVEETKKRLTRDSNK